MSDSPRPATPSEKSAAIFKMVVAFGYFAGKPLKALDAFEYMDDEILGAILVVLREAASSLRTNPREKWPELHKLADDIERILNLK